MKIDVLTLFPDMVRAALSESIVGRASAAGLIDLGFYQIRDFSENKQNKVDDTPYGGGPGMLMTCQPLFSCCRAAREEAAKKGFEKPYTVLMSPRGTRLDAKTAKRLAENPYMMIVCGHYEGIDQRFIDAFCDEEISIGDYVLTGGELPAAVLIDTVSRFVPGVLGSPESGGDESFEKLLLEYPQYTKPAVFEGAAVPEVLTGGNHADIEAWRLKEAEKITRERRPDLFAEYEESAYCDRRVIYFDNSATTRQTPHVTETVASTARRFYGNPSSLTRLGMLAEKELNAARGVIAGTIGADRSEITFTASGTEANNLALKGYLAANKHSGNKVIVSAVEHPSVLETAKSLEKLGYKVELCPVDSRGVVDIRALFEMIDNDTAIISVMMVNSETGAIMPIKEIAAVKNSINPNIILHTDCVQAYGKLKIDVRELGCDMLTASAHKIHGPRGAGFLYAKRGIRLSPVTHGGGQEGGLRSGTENVPAICGFAAAAEDAFNDIGGSFENVKRCRDLFRDLLLEKYGDKIHINSDADATLPYILNVSFSPIRAEVLLHALESENMYVSVGSACSSKKKNRSHVLTAMNVPVKIIDGSVRFSFSRFTTEEEIRKGAEVLFRAVKDLKRAVRG